MKLFKKILQIGTVALIINSNAYAGQKNSEIASDIIHVMLPMYAYGLTFYKGDKEGRKQFYKGFFTNASSSFALKKTINKKRPNGSEESFPSRHTSTAFQGANFVHSRYSLEEAIIPYALATYVAIQRINDDFHYKEDVIAGAVLGVLSNTFFVDEYKDFSIETKRGQDNSIVNMVMWKKKF